MKTKQLLLLNLFSFFVGLKYAISITRIDIWKGLLIAIEMNDSKLTYNREIQKQNDSHFIVRFMCAQVCIFDFEGVKCNCLFNHFNLLKKSEQ